MLKIKQLEDKHLQFFEEMKESFRKLVSLYPGLSHDEITAVVAQYLGMRAGFSILCDKNEVGTVVDACQSNFSCGLQTYLLANAPIGEMQ